jgi:hypothetical protein
MIPVSINRLVSKEGEQDSKLSLVYSFRLIWIITPNDMQLQAALPSRCAQGTHSMRLKLRLLRRPEYSSRSGGTMSAASLSLTSLWQHAEL